MDSTETIATTSALTRRVVQVAEALADYDHLPALGHIGVYASGSVFLSPGYDYRRKDAEVRAVCAWADAFGVPVVIDLSDSGHLVAVLELGGVSARLRRHISHQQAYELGAALGIPVSPGGQVQIEAAALLAALDQHSGVAA